MTPRYECEPGCGACCTQLIVEIDLIDVLREPKWRGAVEPCRVPDGMTCEDEDGNAITDPFGPGAIAACGANHQCPMLDGVNRCTIYPSRPNVCVAFQAGSEQCQMARASAKLKPLVPCV